MHKSHRALGVVGALGVFLGSLLLFSPLAAATGPSDAESYTFDVTRTYDAVEDETTFTYTLTYIGTEGEGDGISHAVVAEFCVDPIRPDVDFSENDGSTGKTGYKTGELDVGDELVFVFDGDIPSSSNGATITVKQGNGQIDRTLAGPSCEPVCVDDPDTTADECNPCVDNQSTPQDECSPCVDNQSTPQDECNPCVDNQSTPENECAPPPVIVEEPEEVVEVEEDVVEVTPDVVVQEPEIIEVEEEVVEVEAEVVEVADETVVRALPRTGSGTERLAGVGIALMAFGAVLVAGSQRRMVRTT